MGFGTGQYYIGSRADKLDVIANSMRYKLVISALLNWLLCVILGILKWFCYYFHYDVVHSAINFLLIKIMLDL